ncbi:hypothetical protein LAZ67_13003039 [Cordylochernes scorpioides]|uniref:Uncharacterized protein n=1 Tax=Cordylochernes scorpioides TaxID=51811 RepID=A0ABY6L501_9ARAC|nr:hypothetical protein LAZ67_13003039 [Cordylochernes scorpioides]
MYGIGNVPEFADQTPITIEEARKKASLRTEQFRSKWKIKHDSHHPKYVFKEGDLVIRKIAFNDPRLIKTSPKYEGPFCLFHCTPVLAKSRLVRLLYYCLPDFVEWLGIYIGWLFNPTPDSQFKRIHEDRELDDDEKMHYLVQAMVPGSRAHRLLGAYTHTGKNYESAIGAQKGRFGDRKLLIELYLRKLIDLVVLNAHRQSANLDRLYDEISAYLQSLESLSIPSEYLEVFLFPLVESCLPTEIMQDVEQGRGDRLRALMGFVRAEIKAQQRMNISRIGVELQRTPLLDFLSGKQLKKELNLGRWRKQSREEEQFFSTKPKIHRSAHTVLCIRGAFDDSESKNL